MNLKHAGDLFKALETGNITEATRYLRTFGSTLHRDDKEDKTGCHSTITIGYYTRRFILEMHNGETLAISVDGVRYTPSETEK